MPPMFRFVALFALLSMAATGALAAKARDFAEPARAASSQCLRMTVTAGEVLRSRDKQHLRIVFENHCDAARIVHWCAAYPVRQADAMAACPDAGTQPTAYAAPSYVVETRREFQWSFPLGTRIRYVACAEGTLPTGDLGCAAPAPRAER